MQIAGSRRWWIVGALALSVLMVGLDITVLNLALPTLADALHASSTQLQWFSVAYTLVVAAAILPAGMLGDRFGRKRLLVIAFILFGAGSLACAYAPSAGAFIAARALLGLGGAVIAPMALAVLPVIFSEEERGKAVAMVMAATAVGWPIGPILGGWILTHYRWGDVFLINLPVSLVALIAVVWLMPESRNPVQRRVDWIGLILSSGGLALLTYGIIEIGQAGWGKGRALGMLIGGIVVLAGFAGWERRAAQPLVDLQLFRSRAFTWGTILATFVSFSMVGVIFIAPQYFQAIMGVDPMGAGIRLLPMVGGLIVTALIVTRLSARIGANVTVAAGFAIIAVGLFIGGTTRLSSGDGLVVLWALITGLGVGLVMPATIDAALGVLEEARSGVGTALMQSVRSVGSSFGVAVLGSILNSAYLARLDLSRLPTSATAAVRQSVFGGLTVAQQLRSPSLLDMVRRAFVHGMDISFFVCAALAVVALVFGLLCLPRRNRTLVEEARAQPLESSHEHQQSEQAERAKHAVH